MVRFLKDKKNKLAYKELFMNFIKMFVAGSLTFIMCVIVSNWFNTFELPKYIFETTKILTISVLCFIAYTMLNLLFKMDYAKDLISRLIYCLRRPYKVKTAKDICNILDVECKDLYGKVKYSQRLMNYTEKIIVIASRYRDKFQEVDYAVNRANFYFLDGDFEASKNIIEKLS